MFKEKQPLSRPQEPLSPYNAAKREWDARMGASVIHSRAWRLQALGSLLVIIVLGGIIAYENSISHIAVYVLDRENQQQIAKVERLDGFYKPQDAEIAYYIRQWVERVRSKPLDSVLLRKNWLEAYWFLTERAAAQLNQYASTNDPFANVGKEARAVEILSTTRLSDHSFQVRWTEHLAEPGAATVTVNYTGLFTYVIVPPSNEQDLYRNPLGIYIDAPFTWTQEH